MAGGILRLPGYASFCGYAFLIFLFSSACPFLFGLVQIKVMGFGNDTVWLMGVVLLAGALLGSYTCGTLVDRLGTRSVFTVVHLGFVAVIFLFMLRGGPSWLAVAAVGVASFLFSLLRAAINVAFNVEMLNLVPKENKSLATSLCKAVMHLGEALSGFLAAWLIRWGGIPENWTLWGRQLSAYDAVLFLYAGMILVTVAVPMGVPLPRWLVPARAQPALARVRPSWGRTRS